MVAIRCPECGEDEDLDGQRRGELIAITCGACGRHWERDPAPRCPRCGGDDLEAALAAIVERSRGTQLSVVATRTVHLCRACEPELVSRYLDGRTPLMPADLPVDRDDESAPGP